MIKRFRRTAAAVTATVALGIGAAAWATSSADAASAATPRCTAGNLAVWVNADSGNGALGTIFYHLDFTNISGHTCHLFGYPGVSATSFGGRQLGPAARRDSGVPATTVNIVPGGTAHAVLGWVDAQLAPACHPARADFLKVFPPNATAAGHAFFGVPVCTTNRIDLTIRRVQPGA